MRVRMGPGALLRDSYMMGMDYTVLRGRMAESLDAVIIQLLDSDDLVNRETDWFTLHAGRGVAAAQLHQAGSADMGSLRHHADRPAPGRQILAWVWCRWPQLLSRASRPSRQHLGHGPR